MRIAGRNSAMMKVFGLAVLMAICAFGQGSNSGNVENTDGKADKNLKSVSRVNPLTQAMEMNLPLASYPGRSGNSTPLNLSYSSKIWRAEAFGTWQHTVQSTQEIITMTDIVPRFGERSSAGWTSSLVAPRIEFKQEFYDIDGKAISLNDSEAFFENQSGSNVLPGSTCYGLPEGGSMSSCTLQGSETVCVGIILDGPTTWDCTTTYHYLCFHNNLPFTAICTDQIEPLPIIQNKFVNRLRVYMPDGSSHEFRKDDFIHSADNETYNLTGTFLSVDSSGMRLEVGGEGQESVLYMPNGSRYIFQASDPLIGISKYASEYVDVNGNRTKFERTSGNGHISGEVTDTIGRNIKDPLYQEKYVNLQAGNQIVPVKGLDGAPRNHTLVWAKLNEVFDSENRQLKYAGSNNCRTGFGSALFPDTETLFPLPSDAFRSRICNSLSPSGSERFNPVVLSEVILPNGTRYKFRYNEYGEITEIRYPTGAREVFEYGIVPQLGIMAPLSYSQANRGVKKRWVYETEQSTPQIWLYNTGEITAPDGSKRKLIQQASGDGAFGFDDPGAGMVKEELTYDTAGQLRSRTLNDRIAKMMPYANAARDTRPNRSVTFTFEPNSNNALATFSKTEYDENGSVDLKHFSHLNVKTTRSYQFAIVSKSTAETIANSAANWGTIESWFTDKLDKTSDTDYLYSSNYLARGISSLPIESRVIDKDGNLISKSQTIYDNLTSTPSTAYPFSGPIMSYGLSQLDCSGTSTPKICWQDPATPYRGHATTSRLFNIDENTWIESHAQKDQFGNPVKAADPIGNITTTEFSSGYKYAYPTKVITPAPGDGISGSNQPFTSESTYDFTTGLVIKTKDAEGRETTQEYNDALLRPTKTIPPAGLGQSITEYNDTPGQISVKAKSQIDANQWTEATKHFDNLGREFCTEAQDAGGTVYSKTKYDNLGRVEKVTNPFRSTANPCATQAFDTAIPHITNYYDEVGRLFKAKAPDGAETFTEWTFLTEANPDNLVGTVVTTTDPAGKKSRSVSNSLGQLARVDEPTSQGLGSLIAPNQPTYYKYDTKGNMVEVKQGVQKRWFKYDSLGRLIRVRQPEQEVNDALDLPDAFNTSGKWTARMTYDVMGNVITTTDANNLTITNTYDKANRPLTRTYNDAGVTPPVSYKYDGYSTGVATPIPFARGAVTEVMNGISASKTTQFDNLSRPLAYQQITDGQTYQSTYQYNMKGLVSETYPSGRTVKYDFNSDGDLARISSKATPTGNERIYANGFAYEPNGNLDRMRLGNGRWESLKYNNRSQLTEISLGASASDGSLWKQKYEYGAIENGEVNTAKNAGNIARQTISFQGMAQPFVQSYQYDSLDRLIEAKETNGAAANATQNWIQTFDYDRYGNRIGFSQNVNGQNLALNNLTHPAINANTNRFNLNQGYQYDKAGNIISDINPATNLSRNFTFNGDNKQIKITDQTGVIGEYFYDGEGKRVKKIVNSTGETTIFVYSRAKLVAEYSTIAPPTNPTINYTATDQLGSPRVLTDAGGKIKSRRDFMPFGEEIGINTPQTQIRSGNLEYNALDNIRQKFTGYQKDSESNLDFAEARYYNNQHGRFTAVDPLLASGKTVEPQSFNRYTYVTNQPTMFTDPTGECPTGKCPANHYGPVYYKKFDQGNARYNDVKEDDSWDLLPVGYSDDFVDSADHKKIHVWNNGYTSGWAEIGEELPVMTTRWRLNYWRGVGNTYDTVLEFPSGPRHGRNIIADGITDYEEFRYTQDKDRAFALAAGLTPSGPGFSPSPASAASQRFSVPVNRSINSKAELAFTNKILGVNSKLFGNSSFNANGTPGLLNQKGTPLKMGWSNVDAPKTFFGNNRLLVNPLSLNNGGMQLRIGIGTNPARLNQGRFHLYVPGTFVPNRFSNDFVYRKPKS